MKQHARIARRGSTTQMKEIKIVISVQMQRVKVLVSAKDAIQVFTNIVMVIKVMAMQIATNAQ